MQPQCKQSLCLRLQFERNYPHIVTFAHAQLRWMATPEQINNASASVNNLTSQFVDIAYIFRWKPVTHEWLQYDGEVFLLVVSSADFDQLF